MNSVNLSYYMYTVHPYSHKIPVLTILYYILDTQLHTVYGTSTTVHVYCVHNLYVIILSIIMIISVFDIKLGKCHRCRMYIHVESVLTCTMYLYKYYTILHSCTCGYFTVYNCIMYAYSCIQHMYVYSG